MHKKIHSGIMLTLLFAGTLALALDIQPVKSEPLERKVGVNIGDWARYSDIAVSFLSDNPSPPVQVDPSAFDIQWLKNIVQAVIDTEITFQMVVHFKNGTEQTQALSVDIDTGSGSNIYFLSADLDAGDRVFSPTYYPTINETVPREYAGVIREMNHVNRSTIEDYGNYVSFASLDGYWDKTTGVLCEYAMLQTYTHLIDGYFTSLLIAFKLTETNIWSSLPKTISDLGTKTKELGSKDEIDNPGIVKSLITKLNVAQKLVDNGKTDQAKTILKAFISQVQNLSGIHITPEAADILIESAEYIVSNL